MTARVHVRGTVDVPLDLLTEPERIACQRELSCPNPARVAAERRKDPRAHRIPATVSTLVVEEDVIRFPVGAPHVYRPLLRTKDFILVDERPSFNAQPLSYRGTLTPYQQATVAALAGVTCGIAVAPCGAGKGEVIAALCGRLGLPTLVVVGQREHATDLRDRINRRLGVDAGLIGDGEDSIERITVGLIQSLDGATIEKIAPAFEVVIVDECHHAAAISYQNVLSSLLARRRYGLTATIDRNDGLRPLVHHLLGPVVHETTRADLIAAGRSVVPAIRTIASDFTFAYRSSRDWANLLDALERDEQRDLLIARMVEHECAGELTAVLVGRIAHAERLAALLRDRGMRAHALTGRLAAKKRTAILDAARGGELDVIVGTQILDEGIDLPRLSRVVLAWPARAEGRIVQRIGRALRVHEGKAPPIVFDIVDERVGVLAWQAKQRARAIERAFGARSAA